MIAQLGGLIGGFFLWMAGLVYAVKEKKDPKAKRLDIGVAIVGFLVFVVCLLLIIFLPGEWA
ncbi:MAG: hypothetical protein ACI4LH_09015 [Candidatus Heritagella sp.]